MSDPHAIQTKEENETEDEYAYRAQPYTFVLRPDLDIYKIYNGWYVAHGVVRWFDLNAGVGMIVRDGAGADVFFHFTALPGQGYRTLRAGTPVKFELIESGHGLTARNIQPKSVP